MHIPKRPIEIAADLLEERQKAKQKWNPREFLSALGVPFWRLLFHRFYNIHLDDAALSRLDEYFEKPPGYFKGFQNRYDRWLRINGWL